MAQLDRFEQAALRRLQEQGGMLTLDTSIRSKRELADLVERLVERGEVEKVVQHNNAVTYWLRNRPRSKGDDALNSYKAIWTVGHFMIWIGLYLVLLVGGMIADERYNVLAAQADSNIPLPEAASPVSLPVSNAAVQPPVVVPTVAPVPTLAADATTMPAGQDSEDDIILRPDRRSLSNRPRADQEINMLPSTQLVSFGPNTITGIHIPAIKVNRKVEPVGTRIEFRDRKPVAVWEVTEYTVGHHINSANPGQQGNIVLSGHSGGSGYPFNELFYLKPGTEIVLTANDKRYIYVVSEKHVLDEVGPHVTDEQRRANLRFIEATPTEQVTLVTCWPLTGKDKFSQRVVIRGVPKQ